MIRLAEVLPKLKIAAASMGEALDTDVVLSYIQQGSPYDSMFYGNLSDANWIGELYGSGQFSKVPDPVENGESIIYPRSLAIRGLARVANENPELSLTILEELPDSDNPYLLDEVMMCIAQIDDVSSVLRSSKLIKSKLCENESRDWLYFDDVLAKWLNIGAHGEIFEALRVYLYKLSEADDLKRANLAYRLNEIDRGILQSLKNNYLTELLQLYYDALIHWKQSQKNQEQFSGDEDGDPLIYWLEDFHHRSSYTHELEATLASWLFAASSDVFEGGNQEQIDWADQLLRADSWKLFSRLRWQLYADFPETSKKWARNEVLERIEGMGHYPNRHSYEMAQLLENHAKLYGQNFLQEDEVTMFVNSVMDGMFDAGGKKVDDDDSARYMKRKQIQPISGLLNPEQALKYQELCDDIKEKIPVRDYMPFRSGGGAKTIEYITPVSEAELAKMKEDRIWAYLNEWEPEGRGRDSDEWWKEQSIGALGDEFAKLVESSPDRFSVETHWWKNINRPEVLSKLIGRATRRLSNDEQTKNGDTYTNISDNSWANWFGVADWIIDKAMKFSHQVDVVNMSEQEASTWDWPCREVINFLQASINPTKLCPAELYGQIGILLTKILIEISPALPAREERVRNDWLTDAINSVPGTAMEALISLAITQKQHSERETPEDWIYSLIREVLEDPRQSPVHFAIMGARLHPVFYLYSDNLKDYPELLLPADRPVCSEAFVTSNVRYSHPMQELMHVLPSYTQSALKTLRELNDRASNEDNSRGDFGGRLGTHLFSYFWNDDFNTDEDAFECIDRYFEIATPSQRASAISSVTRIFSKTTEADQELPLIEKAMQLWDRRFQKITEKIHAGSYQHDDVHSELSGFISWLECKAFPFDWLQGRVLEAINFLDGPPETGLLARTFRNLADEPENIAGVLRILNALLAKEGDIMSWVYRDEDIKPLLKQGIESGENDIVTLAEDAQEILLSHGCFEYLELDE